MGDMVVLRESPWYQEILEEGREQGLKQGLEQARKARRVDLQRMLEHRFGELPADVEEALRPLDLEQLEHLFDIALETETLEKFRAHLPPAQDGSDGHIGSSSLDT